MSAKNMSLTEVKEFFTTHADFWVSPPDAYAVTMGEDWSKQDGILETPEETLHDISLIPAGEGDYNLTPTVESFLALAGAFSLSKSLLADTPADLIEPVFDHHLGEVEADKGPQFLLRKTSQDTLVAESMVHPFNLSPIPSAQIFSVIADALVEQSYVEKAEDVSVRIVHHSPNLTNALLLLPYVEDGWQTGIYASFSISGRTPLVLSMALMEQVTEVLDNVLLLDRWTFKHSPKKHGNTEDLFTDWIEMTTAIIGLEMSNELDEVQQLTSVNIEEDLTKIVQDIFTSVRLPMSLRAIVVDAVEHMDEATGYSLMNAVAATQHAPGIKPAQRERAQRAAGLVGAVLGARCDTCHSLLPENIEHSH